MTRDELFHDPLQAEDETIPAAPAPAAAAETLPGPRQTRSSANPVNPVNPVDAVSQRSLELLRVQEELRNMARAGKTT